MTYDQWRAGHTRYDLVAVHYPNTPEYPYNTDYNTWVPDIRHPHSRPEL